MRTASGTDTLSAALALASDGNKVFPLDGKNSIQGYSRAKRRQYDATRRTRAMGTAPWSQYLGLVTDGLLVLDFDAGHGGLNSKRITANDSSVP
ncbi:MAG: bifunctional DNA primase/polymerase [Chloroflexi bacterium]|nr:bifunctional DNA primase/polymerase [Chloroflexota bacterium]